MKKDFASAFSSFKAGEVLEFEGEAYSRYDSSTVFTFMSRETDERKQWFFHDDQALESWVEYLEEAN